MLRTVLILAEVVLLAGPPRACLCGTACAAPGPERSAAAWQDCSGDGDHDKDCPACGRRHTGPGQPKPSQGRHAPGCPCLRQPPARIERAELARSFWLAAAPLPVPADVTAVPAVSAAPAIAVPPAPTVPLFLALRSLRI
jgi:hypothetical protein